MANFVRIFSRAGFGGSSKSYHVTSLHEALIRGMKTHPNELNPTNKLGALMGKYLHDSNYGALYSKARNLALELEKAYDEVFSKVDVLVMPTCPVKARPFPPKDLSLKGMSAGVSSIDHVSSLPTGSPLGLNSSAREELERVKRDAGRGEVKGEPARKACVFGWFAFAGKRSDVIGWWGLTTTRRLSRGFRARCFPKKRSGEPGAGYHLSDVGTRAQLCHAGEA